ncbi:DUF4387 domain-containing protein [Microbacterium terricola]|uniref:DUF4387 domain-containing protein n=1 Tax=Microbacterium terricola TaxID=344163 RepID=A0ABM8DVF5_9MICO|nr:DUF4387 domain-containing protein [Microbacterium terricola]UYK39663.1 DUF4387 domain-containing protein [Microbacterium terricola]BDV29595.1 hypothetical protein Microterr_02550 [Microbacterium terricola]
MADQTLDEIADLVRAKNAGPFWMTLDVFLPTDAAFDRVCASDVVDPEVVAALYRANAADVRVFPMRALRAIKISFPRPATQGSFADRDMHSGQQHVLLARIAVPGDEA